MAIEPPSRFPHYSKGASFFDLPFAFVMAFTPLMLIPAVVVIFGMAVIYSYRKRSLPVCGIQKLAAAALALTTMSSKVWWILVTQERGTARRRSNLCYYSSKLPIQAFELLFADDESCPKSPSALAANGSINTGTMSRIETGPTGRTTCPCSDIDCAASQERPQSDHLRTSVGPSASDLRSVATERCGSMQPSTPQASSTAVFSSPLSARNRHHGSVFVGASNPFINTPGLSLGPLSVQIPETPASQPTVVPAARHAMHEITHGPTESNEYQPPILLDHSLPIIQGIKIVRHPPAVLRPVPPVSTGEANHRELGGSPSGSSTSRPHHKVFFDRSYSVRYTYAYRIRFICAVSSQRRSEPFIINSE